MDILLITPEHPLYAAEFDLRYRVLRAPLGMSRASTLYTYEAESWHWVAAELSQVWGCVVFHGESPDTGRLLQMAVDPTRQKTGVGRALVDRLERDVAAHGFRRVTLHARETALGFYQRLGYSCYGQPYIEVGLPHRHMHKALGQSTGS
jgi:ribosomal protein S18 acetylase RimI-like enzyme